VIGGDYTAKALEVLKPGGIRVSTLPPTVLPIADDAAKRGIRLAGLLVEADRFGMTALADLAAVGKLSPTIAATYPLDQVADAHSGKAGPARPSLRSSDSEHD
jgi:NADPH:quinone reductase-like Zn-dependent oxidoreductase